MNNMEPTFALHAIFHSSVQTRQSLENYVLLNVASGQGTLELGAHCYTLQDSAIAQLENFIDQNWPTLKKLAKKTFEPLENSLSYALHATHCGCRLKISGQIRDAVFDQLFQQLVALLTQFTQTGAAVLTTDLSTPARWLADQEQNRATAKFQEDYPHYRHQCRQYQNAQELLAALQTTPLYHQTPNGQYHYHDLLKSVAQKTNLNFPGYAQDRVRDFLAEKAVTDLAPREIIDQFLYWYRQEKTQPGCLAKAIDNGQFVALFRQYAEITYNTEWVHQFRQKWHTQLAALESEDS